MAKPGMAESLGHLIPNNANENHEHCVCPEGYAGTLCEHKAEVCPKGERICFHGSKCVKDGDAYFCSCNSGNNFTYEDDRIFSDDGMQESGTIDDDGLGDDEVDENLFSNYYQGGGSDGKHNIDDDEDRRSLLTAVSGGFEDQADLGGTHCQFKATSKCENGHSCFNGGVCYQDKCICHDGFKGPFCVITSSKRNDNRKKQQDARNFGNRKKRQHVSVIIFSFSLAFLGVAFVLLVVAYTRIRIETSHDNEAAKQQMMEALTTRTLPSASATAKQDVNATYLPFPTNENSKKMKMANSNKTHTYISEAEAEAEAETVAELI